MFWSKKSRWAEEVRIADEAIGVLGLDDSKLFLTFMEKLATAGFEVVIRRAE